MNWNETLIRASSVGYLMTEPVTKADKEAGVLWKKARYTNKANEERH